MDRVVAWNTVPTLEAIFFGQDTDFFYISNRPLTIAICLAIQGRRQIRLSRDYITEYLNFGFSVSGCSPFEDVQVLAPRKAISINGSKMAFVDAPVVQEQEFSDVSEPQARGAKELVSALRASTTRLYEATRPERIQLRLSGGQDSRLLLGLLRELDGVAITGVCNGDENSEETQIAAQLADKAGIDFVAMASPFLEPTGVVKSMKRSILETQGVIPSESRVSPYAVGYQLHEGESVASGQWPLFKGVLERVGITSLETIDRLLLSTSSWILNDKGNSRSNRAIEEWKASVPSFANYELLYQWGRDMRSSRYLQAHAIQMDRDAQMFYPFIDSEVAAVADSLTFGSRMNQFASFFAIKEIWPEALEVPLHRDSKFRFERTKPMDGISGPGYELRNAKPIPYRGEVRRHDKNLLEDPEFLSSPLTSLAKFLVSSPRWRQIRRLISVDLRSLIKEATQTSESQLRSRLPKEKGPIWLNIMLSRLLLADVWLEADWLPKIPGK
ncbi:MAG: hypothetical protein ACTHXA_10910 [Gulosibacter sp.]|uniref:hypothetical protein n=1 Tax=Gulosibacter sp. TaxID=2817531 RepID=UPI003F93A5B4